MSDNKIDWKQKLTSRKFWAAVVGFVTPLLIAFGFSDNQVAEATSIIMAGATLIAYIIGEGLVDSSRIFANTTANNTITTTTIKNDKSDDQ